MAQPASEEFLFGKKGVGGGGVEGKVVLVVAVGWWGVGGGGRGGGEDCCAFHCSTGSSVHGLQYT